jgi:heme A synthase
MGYEAKAAGGVIGKRPTYGADLLAVGFGTSVAMWLLGYLARLSPLAVPSHLVAAALLACLVAGGWVAGRFAPRGWRGGMAAGVLASLLNLMILGSLVSGPHPNQVAPSALWWFPGSLLVGALLGAAGAAWGRAMASPEASPRNWTGLFATVAATATLLLLIAGGLVTSNNAGLAVVDWPNSFGYNIFLYPLSRMTGGIYYEHAHRLAGSLVGLTTLVLAVHLQRVERRRWVKRLAWLAVAVVVGQGILGGLRVTGHFTLATSRAAVDPDLTLAVVHGVVAQLFFALVVSLAVFTSSAWTNAGAGAPHDRSVGGERLAGALVAALVVQLVLGSLQRHLGQGLELHIAFAAVVVTLAVTCGLQAIRLPGADRVLRRLASGLLVLAAFQPCLGILAYLAKASVAPGAPPTDAAVLLTTAHQITGAIFLATAVAARLWLGRLAALSRPQA